MANMQIQIYPPIALWEKGIRPKNEDNIYPSQTMADINSTTFLVCDGVGGMAKGELASHIVANTFGAIFDHQIATSTKLHNVLQEAQQKIDQHICTNEQDKGMGTTFTFLQLNPNGAIIAHAGDSRVYHIRNDQILFCTFDHSLVNELMKKGKTEEAKLAKSNVLTRAVQGNSVKPITLDIYETADIQAGDYFLLCSDGVWGVIPNDKLIAILASDELNTSKIDLIHQICDTHSRDNFSAYLIEIKDVKNNVPSEDTIGYLYQDDHPGNLEHSGSAPDQIPQLQNTNFPGSDRRHSEFSKEVIIENRNKRHFPWWTFILILLVLSFVILAFWRNSEVEAFFRKILYSF